VLHPGYPTVEGKYQMTREWSVLLPGPFNRRLEDGNLVLWCPGLTIWAAVWRNDHNKSAASRLGDIKAEVSEQAFDLEDEQDTKSLRFSYRLTESADRRCPSFYGFVVGQEGHVQLAFYFDDEADLAAAKEILRSLCEEQVLH
jgi:hypothetical protein